MKDYLEKWPHFYVYNFVLQHLVFLGENVCSPALYAQFSYLIYKYFITYEYSDLLKVFNIC